MSVATVYMTEFSDEAALKAFGVNRMPTSVRFI